MAKRGVIREETEALIASSEIVPSMDLEKDLEKEVEKLKQVAHGVRTLHRERIKRKRGGVRLLIESRCIALGLRCAAARKTK